MIALQYKNLHEMLYRSNSSRNYFLSLPVSVQMELHKHNDYINTAEELHKRADEIKKYNHAVEISEFYGRNNNL